jgi:hypothetical protein
LPYEVPQEILLERRSTNDDGTDFQRDEDGKSYYFFIRHKSLEGAFYVYYFIFFLAAFINYFTIKEKEIAIQIPFTRRYMASKISAFDK